MSAATPTLRIVLLAEPGLGEVSAKLSSFISFDYEMEEDLTDLEKRWEHLAAPQSGGRQRAKNPKTAK